MVVACICISYTLKFWRWLLFGNLANWIHNAKFKCCQYYKWTQLHMLQGTVHQIKIIPKFIFASNRQIFNSPIFPLIWYTLAAVSNPLYRHPDCSFSFIITNSLSQEKHILVTSVIAGHTAGSTIVIEWLINGLCKSIILPLIVVLLRYYLNMYVL